jgi:hypothetical protein
VKSRFGKLVLFGQVGAICLLGLLVTPPGAAASSITVTLPDTYFGGNNNFNSADVLENTNVWSFDTFGATATRNGSDLTVKIYTNYANAVGAENTGLGYLFLGTGPATLSGSAPQHTSDTFTANAGRFQYAGSIPYNGSGSGTGSVYQLAGNGTDVQTSFYGNTNGSFPPSSGTACTTSPCNGGAFRTNQAVGLLPNNTDQTVNNVTESWVITAGTTQTNHTGFANSGTSDSDYAGDGSITFTLANIFSTGLGGPNGIVTIAWAMTCANDVFLSDFDLQLPNHNNPAPLPAALPMFASGAGLFGFLSWRRKKKATAAM